MRFQIIWTAFNYVKNMLSTHSVPLCFTILTLLYFYNSFVQPSDWAGGPTSSIIITIYLSPYIQWEDQVMLLFCWKFSLPIKHLHPPQKTYRFLHPLPFSRTHSQPPKPHSVRGLLIVGPNWANPLNVNKQLRVIRIGRRFAHFLRNLFRTIRN